MKQRGPNFIFLSLPFLQPWKRLVIKNYCRANLGFYPRLFPEALVPKKEL
jgi:hypothetical protein